MKCGHHLDALVVLKFSSETGDAFFCVEEVFHRRVAEHDDHFRLNDGNFAQEERLAGLRLLSIVGVRF